MKRFTVKELSIPLNAGKIWKKTISHDRHWHVTDIIIHVTWIAPIGSGYAILLSLFHLFGTSMILCEIYYLILV